MWQKFVPAGSIMDENQQKELFAEAGIVINEDAIVYAFSMQCNAQLLDQYTFKEFEKGCLTLETDNISDFTKKL